MRTTRPSPIPVVLAALVAGGLALPARARAGVTIDTRMDVSMLGGGGRGTGRVEIEGKARRETRTIALGSAGSDMGQEQRSDALTRLDRGTQWQIDADDSSYRAVPLARLGAEMDRAGVGGMPFPGLSPDAAATLTWQVTVTPRDDTARIAGYDARRTDITLTGTAHGPETGDVASLRLVTQWWMSGAVPGAGEVRAFDAGFELATNGLGADVPGLLAGLPGSAEAIARLTAARRGLKGVPLRTVLSVEAPGLAAMLQSMGGEGNGADGGGDGAAHGADAPPLVTSVIEVTSIRAGRIPAAHLALPRGFHAAAAEADAPPAETHE